MNEIENEGFGDAIDRDAILQRKDPLTNPFFFTPEDSTLTLLSSLQCAPIKILS